jgi:hypothetical protein
MKVYIAAPARVYTGGPTALFQLCHTLRRVFGVDSYMAFYNMKPHEDPVHDNYKHFQYPWTSINEVYDSIDNVVIVPETATSLLSKFSKIKKIIYWLAVDNYVLTNYVYNLHHKKYNIILKFIWFILKNYPYDLFSIKLKIIENSYLRFYLNSFYSSYVIELIKRRNVRIPATPSAIIALINNKMCFVA